MSDELTELRAENERLRADLEWNEAAVSLREWRDRFRQAESRLGEFLQNELAAKARAEKAEQECRDRECTEQDVRARLADAENTLADLRRVFGNVMRYLPLDIRSSVRRYMMDDKP